MTFKLIMKYSDLNDLNALQLTRNQKYRLAHIRNVNRSQKRQVSTKKGYKILKFHYWNGSRDYGAKKPFGKIVYKVVLYVNKIKQRIVRFFFSKERLTRFLSYCLLFGIVISSCFVIHKKFSFNLEASSKETMQVRPTLCLQTTTYPLKIQPESGIFYNDLEHDRRMYDSEIADYKEALNNIQSSYWNSLKENTTLSIGFDASSAYKPVCTYLDSSTTPVQRLSDRNRNWLAYRLTQLDRISQSVLQTSFTPFLSFELDTSQNEIFQHAKSCVKGLYVPGIDSSRLSYSLQVPSPIKKNILCKLN